MGSGGIAPRMLNLWHKLEVIDHLQTAPTLPSSKEPPVRIGWDAGWTPESVWTLWTGENYRPLQ
jgi:hypothetical protein